MIPCTLLFLGLLASTVSAAETCNSTQSCPEDAPCCNQYGECGSGPLYCLGGCHPAFSYDIYACAAMPVCQNIETTFDDASSIMSVDDYFGDANATDWVYTGYLEDYDGANLLAMPNQTSGTVVSSTRFIWYGKVGATFKTSRGDGVVSAFILFSNAQDEIDWEFVGYNLTSAESNFYFQGELNYTNVVDIDATDTFEYYHTYEVDWKEDQLDWYLDGELVRTLKKEDTWNETEQVYKYPQTPSRVQFSLWPAGDSDATGTIEWAGGVVDWNSEDIVDYGYYYVTLLNASIECYDPPAGTLITGSSAYTFNNTDKFTQEYVMITNNSTEICDDDSSGLDSQECAVSSSSSSSAHSSSSHSSSSSSRSASSGSTTSTGEQQESTTTVAATETTDSTTAATGFVQFAGGSSSSSNNAVSLTGSVGTLLLALSWWIV